MTETFTCKTYYFATGVYLALLQFSYYFLVEAFLSSRAVSYFIALFFWLCGFLIGLNLKKSNLLLPLLALSLASYYCSFFLVQWIPFNNTLFYILGVLIALSSSLAGYFFAASSDGKVKTLLLHENNGFILGAFISLMAADFAGWYYLLLAPVVGAILMVTSKYLSGDTERSTP
jgi:hypothetical protein